MRHKLHILVRSIVLGAFLAGIIAPACSFMWGGKYSVIEICTANGLENRVVMNDESPDAPSSPMMVDNCEFCFASANLVNFLPKAILMERITFIAEKLKFQQYEDIVVSKYNTNISSRGPPAFI